VTTKLRFPTNIAVKILTATTVDKPPTMLNLGGGGSYSTFKYITCITRNLQTIQLVQNLLNTMHEDSQSMHRIHSS
jgi:hypothetical protein